MTKSNWVKYKLNECIEINPKTQLKKGTKAKKVDMDKLMPFTRKISGYVETNFTSGSKFINGDTLLARITPCLENGKTAYVDILEEKEVAFGSTEFIVLRAKKDITYPLFVYYLAISPSFREKAISFMSGTSGRQRVDIQALSNLETTFPPLDEQKMIAEVLGAFDDKIELLQKQNKTLEEMANTLFNNFLNINKCKYEYLTNIAEIKYGKGLSSNKLTKKGYKVFGGNGIIGHFSEYMYDLPQILISCRGAASGNIWESYPFSFVTSNSLVVQMKDRNYYEFIKRYLKLNLLHQYATGSAQPQITIDNLKYVKVPYPAKDKIRNLDITLNIIADKIYHNIVMIETLTELRDTLLPRLISGKIKV